LQGFSYREIEKRLEVSTSFIAQKEAQIFITRNRGIKVKISRFKQLFNY